MHVTNGPYAGPYPGYHPCGEEHTVTVNKGEDLPFYEGWVDYNHNGNRDSNETAIIWLEIDTNWRGEKEVEDGHASAAYKSITEIETAKS